MTSSERERLKADLSITKPDVINRGLVALIDGDVDMFVLPGGWKLVRGTPSKVNTNEGNGIQNVQAHSGDAGRREAVSGFRTFLPAFGSFGYQPSTWRKEPEPA